jgi:signal transduction histidine kinase
MNPIVQNLSKRASQILFLTLLILNLGIAGSQLNILKENRISGLIPDINDVYGVSFCDYNNDGYPDLYLVSFRTINRLLINNGGIIPFIDRTMSSGLGGYLMNRGKSDFELGSCSADYDNDGLNDIFLAGWGKTVKLFHNEDHFSFKDHTEKLNIDSYTSTNQAIWFDADNDGLLDIYLTDEHSANRYLKNTGNGYFKERRWTTSFIDTAVSQSGCVTDFNNDRLPDLYIANWFSPDYLLINRGNNLFEKRILPLPTLTKPYVTNSASAADLDNDGDSDLLIPTKDGYLFYYRNDTVGDSVQFTIIDASRLSRPGVNLFGALIEDFDNDGYLDCFVTADGTNRLFINNKNGNFYEDYDESIHSYYSTGSAAADLENDGDLDLFVANKNGYSQIYLNPLNKNNSIRIKINGVSTNRQSIGARVYFYSNDSSRTFLGMREVMAQKAYVSSGPAEIHFGMGNRNSVVFDVHFPNGNTLNNKIAYNGQLIELYEYDFVKRNIMMALTALRSYLKHPDFWSNLFYVFLLFSTLWLYLYMSFRRYRWQLMTTSLIFLTLVLIMIVSFILYRDFSLNQLLSRLNVIITITLIVSIFFAEYYLYLRRKQAHFHRSLRQLSNQFLSYIETVKLYKALLESLKAHTEIKNSKILVQQNNNAIFQIYEGKKAIQLNREIIDHLMEKDHLTLNTASQFENLFSQLGSNVLIPLKMDERLFAVVSFKVNKLQREDLQMLTTICNQASVLLKNNDYIKEKTELSTKLAEARVREKYTKELEQKNKALDQSNLKLQNLLNELGQKEAQLVHSEKMASLGQLVAGISHELNNPISFIYANSKALTNDMQTIREIISQKKQTDSSMSKQLLDIINDIEDIVKDNISGSLAIKDLVLNLRNFSRIDQTQWKTTRLSEGIIISVKLLKPQLTENISIHYEFIDDPEIYCNPGQLNQVFVNIISNAIQAIGAFGKINIKSYNRRDYLCIEITDTGSGIDKKHIKKIFDPFFTTKDVNQGTGLGLSVSYSIIKEHGGKLSVSSEVGKGATFLIELPSSLAEKKKQSLLK